MDRKRLRSPRDAHKSETGIVIDVARRIPITVGGLTIIDAALRTAAQDEWRAPLPTSPIYRRRNLEMFKDQKKIHARSAGIGQRGKKAK